jgi:hypothetical protein
MRHLLGLTLLGLLVPGLAPAQEAPEALLSAKTQLYIRWDGIDAHKEAHAKTALGKMLQGDMGTFVTGLFGQMQEGLGTLLTVEQLLGGAPPEKLQQMQADAAEAAKLLPILGQHGFILAGELRSLEPPEADLTLIVPNVGPKSKPLFGAIRLFVNLSKGEIKEHKFGKRTISHVEVPPDVPVHLSWWLEGAHAVIHLGTENPEALARRLDNPNRARLAENPLFKRIAGFKEFETSARAFVDAEALVRQSSTRGPEVKKLLDELGVASLKSVVLYSGFAGEAERGLLELEVPGPKKGILGLFRGRPFTLANLPPLPPDVVSWNMTSLDAGNFYDVAMQTVEAVTRVLSPDHAEMAKGLPTLINLSLGLDLRKDLLGALDDQFVGYTSPSEGPLTMGQVLLFKVKEGEKVKASIEQVVKAISRLGAGDIALKKRTYHGVEVREVRVKTQGFFFVPTYAIHKGWLAIALFPQPVHGFLLRADGAMPGWKPSPKVQALLDEMPKEMVSLSYSDPRPTIKQLLSLAPTIGGLVTTFVPETSFQIGTIPNAQEACLHLFPNVSVTTATDKLVRVESRSSLPLPFDLSGSDSYAVFFFLASVGRFGVFGF